MRIDSKDTICNVPIMKVRNILRGHPGYHSMFDYFATDLNISKKLAQDLIYELEKRGYIRKCEGEDEKKGIWWELTMEGRAFTMASAAPPISRKSAEKKIKELLERINEINSSEEYAFRVSIAVIFGSYLDRNRESVNDIDIGYEIKRKENSKEIVERNKKEKSFTSWQDELFWPERKVRSYLKKRSRAYSLHKFDEIIGFVKDKEKEITVEILYTIPELSKITSSFLRQHPDTVEELLRQYSY